MDVSWPTDSTALVRLQKELAAAQPALWRPPTNQITIGGVFFCSPRGGVGAGSEGDAAWVGAAVIRGEEVIASATITGAAGAAYQPGLLAMREGPLLGEAVKALHAVPPILLVNATGHDHPRRAGLALHLGAVFDIPSVGVTDRPLLAQGEETADVRGAKSPLMIGGAVVACRLRTRPGARPLVVHPGWRTDIDGAVQVVLAATGKARTPEPLRLARRLARECRGRSAASRGSTLIRTRTSWRT